MNTYANNIRINIILACVLILLALALYIFFKAENIVTTASFQLDRAELIGKTLLRGCNVSQI